MPDQRGRLAGALFVFPAACGFSAQAVIIKLAYAYGVAPATPMIGIFFRTLSPF
jgi:hypothetical protein